MSDTHTTNSGAGCFPKLTGVESIMKLQNLRVSNFKNAKGSNRKYSAYLTWVDTNKNEVHTYHISEKLAKALIDAGMEHEG